MIWLWLAFVVMLASFGWWCWLHFAVDDERPIRELDEWCAPAWERITAADIEKEVERQRACGKRIKVDILWERE